MYDDDNDFGNDGRDDNNFGLSFFLAWLNPSGHEGSFFERMGYYWWRILVFKLKFAAVVATLILFIYLVSYACH